MGRANTVYFVQGEKTGSIKIGVSQEALERIRDLQASSPDRLLLLGLERGGEDREAALHRKFSSYRTWGEWFRPGEDLFAYICENTTDPYSYYATRRRKSVLSLLDGAIQYTPPTLAMAVWVSSREASTVPLKEAAKPNRMNLAGDAERRLVEWRKESPNAIYVGANACSKILGCSRSEFGDLLVSQSVQGGRVNGKTTLVSLGSLESYIQRMA